VHDALPPQHRFLGVPPFSLSFRGLNPHPDSLLNFSLRFLSCAALPPPPLCQSVLFYSRFVPLLSPRTTILSLFDTPGGQENSLDFGDFCQRFPTFGPVRIPRFLRDAATPPLEPYLLKMEGLSPHPVIPALRFPAPLGCGPIPECSTVLFRRVGPLWPCCTFSTERRLFRPVITFRPISSDETPLFFFWRFAPRSRFVSALTAHSASNLFFFPVFSFRRAEIL